MGTCFKSKKKKKEKKKQIKWLHTAHPSTSTGCWRRIHRLASPGSQYLRVKLRFRKTSHLCCQAHSGALTLAVTVKIYCMYKYFKKGVFLTSFQINVWSWHCPRLGLCLTMSCMVLFQAVYFLTLTHIGLSRDQIFILGLLYPLNGGASLVIHKPWLYEYLLAYKFNPVYPLGVSKYACRWAT